MPSRRYPDSRPGRDSAAARERGYRLVCVGVPKTVDNDVEGTDSCPGFGIAAKYLATSMLEAAQEGRPHYPRFTLDRVPRKLPPYAF